jgi:hypothetical protein
MMVQAATVRIVLNQRRVFDSSLGITSQAIERLARAAIQLNK